MDALLRTGAARGNRERDRNESADCSLLEKAGVDVAFIPTVEEMYPTPDTRQFDLGEVAAVMEGPMRPGHFNGVAQIVSKLFAAVMPHRAYFGEKDFQQIAVIKRMVELEGFDIEIVECPIKRAADGLARLMGPSTISISKPSSSTMRLITAICWKSFSPK